MLRTTLLLGLSLTAVVAPRPRVADARLVGENAAGERVDLGADQLPLTSLEALGLVAVQVQNVVARERPDPSHLADLAELTLAGGERVAGSVAGGSGEVLSLRLFGDVILPVDVGSLASLVFAARVPEGRTEPLAAPPELDRLYVRVGQALDTIDGTVEEFTAEGVRFDGRRVGARVYPWSEVTALFVEVLEESGGSTETRGAPVVVDLADGSRLRGRMQSLGAAGLDLLVGTGAAIHLPLDVLAEVVRDDGSVAFVSDRAPDAELGRGNPFDPEGAPLGMVWPARADRAATGGPLRAGGRVWRHGIGVHAPSTLRYELRGAWRELRGSVAIDDSVLLEPAKGSVVFRIEVDGEFVWKSPVLAAGDGPLRFPAVSLEGKNTLVLTADMATDLHQGDRANWLRMMLVR